MEKEINKIYCKLNNEKIIEGYFICFAKEPKYKAMGCNFDESKDFENAVVISQEYIDKIHIGFSKVENDVFVENKEQFKQGE